MTAPPEPFQESPDPERGLSELDPESLGSGPEMPRIRPRRGPTLADLAQDCEVSVATVSKVLHDRPGVSEATRGRVWAAIARHGKPRLQRPGRTSGRPEALELLFFELESTWAIQVLWGAQQAAAESGCSVMISGLGGRFFPPDEWVHEAIGRRPVAVIAALTGFTDPQYLRFVESGIPVVVLEPPRVTRPEIPTVHAANRQGMFLATRHLLGLGHRRIALVAGPEAIPCALDRQQGYRAAMAAAGAAAEVRVQSGNMHSEDGLRCARALLDADPGLTALLATNDLQAMGVYEAVRERGLRVPDDVSVVGFDNLSVASWMAPGLTTVHQPVHELAVAATDLALCLAWDTPTPKQHVEMATRLVVRHSTAPPSGNRRD